MAFCFKTGVGNHLTIVRHPLTEQEQTDLDEEWAKRQAPKPAPLPNPGYVYLIKFTSGIYKIGASNQPETRFKAIRKEYGKFEVIHLIWSSQYMQAEDLMHRGFQAKKVGPERFMLDANDVATFTAIERLDL